MPDERNYDLPNTRNLLLDGLRQGLQASVVRLFMNLSSAAETEAEARAMAGLDRIVKAYESGWAYIDEHYYT